MLTVHARHVKLPSGRVLWVETYGCGSTDSPAILFANGMASTTNAWNSLVHRFSDAFLTTNTVILHDAANIGKSFYQPDLPAPSLSSMAAEARMLLENLGWQSGYWVGHSFGGQQGFFAAAESPDFWKGLLLIAPQTDRVTGHCRKSMNDILSVFRAEPETSVYADEIYNTPGDILNRKNGIYGALAREMALRQRAESLVLAFDALLAPEEGDFAWDAMKTHIVLVFGGRDEIAPVSEGQYALEKLRSISGTDVQLVTIADSGHWLNWEHEDQIRDLIVELATPR